MDAEEIKALMKLLGAAEAVFLIIKGKRIALGPDVVAEILAALEGKGDEHETSPDHG